MCYACKECNDVTDMQNGTHERTLLKMWRFLRGIFGKPYAIKLKPICHHWFGLSWIFYECFWIKSNFCKVHSKCGHFNVGIHRERCHLIYFELPTFQNKWNVKKGLIAIRVCANVIILQIYSVTQLCKLIIFYLQA